MESATYVPHVIILVVEFLASVLNSFSQIFFKSNSLLGAALIIVVGLFSPIGLILALLGAIVTNATATLLGLPKEVIRDGIVGFNGLLAGASLTLFVKNFPHAIMIAVILSILCALIFLLLYKNNIPPLAAPFVLAIWIFLLISKYIK